MLQKTFIGLALAASAVTLGCGGKGEFPVAYTSGQVLCEGQPVPHVLVFFEPLAVSQSAVVGKQGIGRADENGKFVVSTYGNGDGAVLGKHRVRVAPPRESVPGFSCDCVLHAETDIMHVEIQEGTKHEFDVVLQKKTGKEAPIVYEDDDD